MQRHQSAWRNGKKRCSVAAKPAGRGEFGESAVCPRGRRPCQAGRAVPRAVGCPQRQLSACGGGDTGSRSGRAANSPRQRLATPTCAVRCASCTRAPGITSRAAGRADSALSLRPRADRRRRRCRRKVAGATPRAHLRTRGPVSAGRWSTAGTEGGTGHRPPAQAAAGARQRRGSVPPPHRPRVASLRGGGHRLLPARPPFPPISTCGTDAVTDEDQLLCGRGQLVATERAPRRPNYRRSERASRTASEPGAHTSRGGNCAHRGPPAAAEPPRLTSGAEEREPPLRATAGSFCEPGLSRRGGCPGLRLRPSVSVGLQPPPRQALRRARSGRSGHGSD